MVHSLLMLAVSVAAGTGGTGDPGPSKASPPTGVNREFSVKSELGFGLRWGYSVLFLVNEKNVQKELQLTPEQMLAITRFAGEYLDSLRLFAEENRETINGKPGPVQADRMREKQTALLIKYGDASLNVLSAEQQRRLEQVAFQLCGFEAFRYREVMEDLNLSETQKSQIVSIRNWLISECKAVHSEHVQQRHDVSGFREAVDRILAEAKERSLATLTPEQRQLFKSMEGPRIGFARHDLAMRIQKAVAAPKTEPVRQE